MSSDKQNHPPPHDDATVVLRIARDRKARWVKLSRDEGKKLTDWIVERVERDDAASTPDERR
jgi:hypothetical protein